MSIEKAYELADEITEKFNAYTQIRVERWNFNHKDDNQPRISYHFGGQGYDPIAFIELAQLIIHLEAILND